MKTLQKLIALAFLLIAVAACQDHRTPTPPCKVSFIDRGNGNKHTYTSVSYTHLDVYKRQVLI